MFFFTELLNSQNRKGVGVWNLLPLYALFTRVYLNPYYRMFTYHHNNLYGYSTLVKKSPSQQNHLNLLYIITKVQIFVVKILREFKMCPRFIVPGIKV